MSAFKKSLKPPLNRDGKRLNHYLFSLVRKGLELQIQQAMEVLPGFWNEAKAADNSRTQEDKEMALKFFDL